MGAASRRGQTSPTLFACAKTRIILPCPRAQIRTYFGEKIALYFAFVGYLTSYLAIHSLVAIASGGFSIYTYITEGDMINRGSVLYAVLCPIWINLMLETWKRNEIRLAMRWGMTEFEDKEVERPDYEGELIVSYVDGGDMKYFPTSQARDAESADCGQQSSVSLFAARRVARGACSRAVRSQRRSVWFSASSLPW